MAKKAAKKATTAKTKSRKVATRKGTKRRQGTKARKSATSRPSARTARARTASRSGATRARRRTPAPTRPSRLASAGTAVRGGVAGAVAAVSKRLGRGDADPDAIQILEQDHRRFEALLKQGEETTERARTARQTLLSTITSELNAHELMEEKVLYPALQSHPEAREIVLEGYEEHHVADLILAELREVATDDEQWGAKFKVLKENIEHHIEEEEGEMFRTARGIFSREELHGLAERMLALRKRSGAPPRS